MDVVSNNTNNEADTGVVLTEPVVKFFKESLEQKPDAIGIKLGIKKNGCSGMSHTLEFVYELPEHAKVFDCNDISVIVDKTDYAKYLKGVKLVYKEDGINSGIEFVNPNATGECGCGESFTVG